jgi:rubrerythrin
MSVSISLNAFEVFEIAERIERNSVNFYRRASQAVADENLKEMLQSLGEFEKEHVKCYENMRKEISAKEWELITFDPENEMSLYLQDIADNHVFDPRKDPGEELKDKGTAKDILEYAINAEKEKIIFYLGLKNYVPAAAAKNKVDEIINEEMNHIAELNLRLSASRYIEQFSI